MISGEISKLLKKGVIKEYEREKVILFVLFLLGVRKMEACAII